MTDVSNDSGPEGDPKAGKAAGGFLKWAIIAFAAVGAVAVLYVIASASFKPAGAPDLNSLAKGEMKKLVVASAPQPAPAIPFTDGAGKTVTLAQFKGKVTVVNFWATWCGPCVTEMPSLAKLQAAYAGAPLQVVAISVDRADDVADARKFLAQHGSLAFYSDPNYALPFGVTPRIAGLPTTIIYDRKGMELARLSGGADWSGRDAHAVIDAVLKGK
jgi:thiol-disulfide isomerase/thioredoxin